MSSRADRANAIRALAMDAVERAQSGHPGAPMGLADVAEVLWRDVLRHNPGNPGWINRDRFVLSNGHGSMLLYAVLHLTGYDVGIEDLKRFRQLDSATAGHPELGHCPGVETTTGPLGQGFANAVGMAIAERVLAATFNRDELPVIDHRTWVVAGDGCLMEGISHEAASLAGTLGLGRLNCIYDSNGISIDGAVAGWFTEDVAARFRAYGWHVVPDVDGHDAAAVQAAIAEVLAEEARPSLIVAKTVIGFGAPTKQGTASAHGAALGADEIAAARRTLNWGFEPFEIPSRLYESWDMRARGAALEDEWNALFERYRAAHPALAEELLRRLAGRAPPVAVETLEALARDAQDEGASIATRIASQRCLSAVAPLMPELIGGSADLTGSNGTRFESAETFTGDDGGNYINYGVREFGMTAVSNGILLHGGFRPYSGTFLVFMDYARNAVRLAALMGIPNIFVYTHDSVALGEDGPTHQPIEHLTMLRATPNMVEWRPADTVETAVAWRAALLRGDGPTAMVLTRQKVPVLERPSLDLDEIARGGYVIRRERSEARALLIATGSEVQLALAAAASLAAQGIDVRVVSMPSTAVFLAQPRDYRDAVLPPAQRARVAVEAGQTAWWRGLVGLDGAVVGIDRFGVSAPGEVAMDALGMTTEAVLDAVRSLLPA